MPATQLERPIRFATALGDDALLLDSLTGRERLSTPYRFAIRVLATDPSLDVGGLLLKPACLAIRIGDDEDRYIHGYVDRVQMTGEEASGFVEYDLEIVPWLWLLSYFTDCRIFQQKTIPEIVDAVFRSRNFSDFRFALNGAFAKREYVVQYRETDLNFVSRLLEDEGIFYYFEQTRSGHTLVLCDHPSALKPCTYASHVRFMAASGEQACENRVLSLKTDLRPYPGITSLTDFDFQKPGTHLNANARSKIAGEEYEYPGNYRTRQEGDRYARMRLEEKEARHRVLRGSSTCTGFECGYRFALEDHELDALNRNYTIVSLDHCASNPSYRSGEAAPLTYTNAFEAIPDDVPFRPQRITPKPRIDGAQTAIVVGKPGEEIWTDPYGRVKVQFHWDREGSCNHNSSCWIRVAQASAGSHWGSLFTPRIGQEVIVHFLEGDPDRPIITGCVYNADNMPPYPLPQEQTTSLIKTRSSKGGGGYNELRFEDKKGEERIFIQAQRDMEALILNDRTECVRAEEHRTVCGNAYEQFKADRHVTVSGELVEKVDASSSLIVSNDSMTKIGRIHALEAGSEIHLKAGTNLVLESGSTITLKAGNSFITLGPSGVTISGSLVMINSGGSPGSGAGATPESPRLPRELETGTSGEAVVPAPPEPVSPATFSPAAVVMKSAALTGAWALGKSRPVELG